MQWQNIVKKSLITIKIRLDEEIHEVIVKERVWLQDNHNHMNVLKNNSLYVNFLF